MMLTTICINIMNKYNIVQLILFLLEVITAIRHLIHFYLKTGFKSPISLTSQSKNQFPRNQRESLNTSSSHLGLICLRKGFIYIYIIYIIIYMYDKDK